MFQELLFTYDDSPIIRFTCETHHITRYDLEAAGIDPKSFGTTCMRQDVPCDMCEHPIRVGDIYRVWRIFPTARFRHKTTFQGKIQIKSHLACTRWGLLRVMILMAPHLGAEKKAWVHEYKA